MKRAERTRLWNHLMRMGDKEFEQLFADARMRRATNKFYKSALLHQLKQISVFSKAINGRN